MAKRIMVITLVFLFGATLAGCATNGYYSPERSMAAGALGGAATGAAVGSIVGAGVGNPVVGAWVGAAAGGVAGAAGGYLYAQQRNYSASASAVPPQSSYNAPQGHDSEKTPGFAVWRKTSLSD